YDPDTIYDGSVNGTQTSREKIALGCSSISTEAGSGEEFENITFDPDVCEPTFYKFTNPSCTFTVDADASGPIAIYCRAFDGEMWSKEEIPMTIIIDATPPQITVISPDEGAVQRKGFSVNVHDADDTGLASCSYRVLDNGVETKNTTARTCSSPVTITIGVGRDCPTQGSSSCKVEFFAKDTSGNNASASRSFSVEYLYSNITSPPAGSFRRTNFSVSIMDTNTGGGGFSSCEYMVKNIVNNTAETTRDWTVRTCNSPLKLTAGPEADCKEQGNNTCIIYAKAHAQSGSIAIDGEMASRAFSIDYTSPYSEITSPASGVWTNNNFIVQIADYDPSGLGISECEYRVLSNGIETVPFKSRSCNSGVQIILGRDCTEEPQCTVQARAYSVSGNIGALAERNFTVILSNVMLDGFVTPLGAVQSDRGVDFSGTLASSIKMTFPTFRSCPTTASISECKSAFSSTVNNCDQDGNCLCGGLNALSCSARCNDRTAEFYFLATGFSGSKQIDVVSSISSVECPTFNIDELNGWIQLFEEVRQQVFIMKQQAYTLYLQTPNNTDLQYAISKLTEAYGLADNHITNMTIVMQDLTVPKSQSLMQRSVEINQQILGILNSICTQTTICYQPANFTLSIETPLSARLGEQVVVNAVLLKKGTLDTYNKISCSITPPSGPTIFYVTKCTKIPADMQFYMNMTNETIVNASQPGQYSVTCSATNSFINDCSITFPIETKTRTFVSVPPIDSYITSVSQLPPSATNGSSVSIVVNARNPDDFDRFGFASCTFARPCAGASCQRNESVSACERIGANESKDFSVSNVVDTVGTWTLERCVLNVTANTNCALSRTHNTSSINAKVNVTGNPLAIIAITPPSNNPAVNSTALTRITLENFNSSASSAAVDCVYASPSFTAYLNSSDTVIVPPFNFDTHVSGKAAANVSIVANELGVWTLTKCNAYTGSNNDEKEINATFAVGPPLSIISISTPGSLSENSSANATINAANLNSSSVSVYGKCVYLSPSGGRHNVTSQNITISAFNKSSIIISKIVEEPGEWNIERCSLYRYQNAFVEERTVNASFYVGLPISINSVITPSSVEVGAHAVTSIYVKNSKSIPLMVVANCLYRTPLFVGKNVLSLNATIPGRGGNITNVSYTVNETGIWNVISCSISLVNGAQQDEKFPNAQFAVGLPPAVCGNGQCELNETVTTCSQDCRTSHVVCGNGQCEATETSASCGIDCSSNACTTNADTPGTDDRCKCQNSVVVACPVGYMCVSHKCETTAPPPECAIDSDCRGGEICENNACIQAQSCSSRIDCTDGRVCLSGKCASASTSQCTSSSDCPSDKICESGVCTPQPIQPQGIDSGVIFFIIIIIAVITIPIIIFTYLRRTVDEI
ncbi:MAG TPA: hypothetical protein VI968_01800, partial [archaeon]|nr:hypothetical protein [archaeon]